MNECAADDVDDEDDGDEEDDDVFVERLELLYELEPALPPNINGEPLLDASRC